MRRPVFVAFCVFAGSVALLGVLIGAEPTDQAQAASEPATGSENAAAPPRDPASNDAAAPAGPENPFPNRLPAPGLEGGVDWLNSAGPITLGDLRGKVVLLDFWTYCCINCLHVLPDLEYLEQKFDDELVVVGVHSAKFDNEKESDAIRDAILRYEIAHPVINDADMLVWRKYGARSWPTLVLIDPEGNYCGYVSGEGMRDVLEENIEKLIAYHGAKGTLDRTPIRFDLERFKQQPTPLRYPGKILADSASNRLFISDSNHNRIVVASFDGKLLETIGSGRIGRADGSYADAEFDHPQGMALDGQALYVADTENHLIRTIDLAARRVSTLAGTGEQAQFREPAGALRATNLNSPWDVLIHDGVLFVAMAGPHQVWSHELGSDQIGVWAGSGREDVLNGPRFEAALAQPSGLASDGEALFVCDSEGSAIRRIPFDASGDVTTVAGPSDLPNGRSLFEFGDINGVGDEVRLQHPLGIAFRGGILYVADSYNHQLKVITLDDEGIGTVEPFLGTRIAGDSLEPVQLSEPAGLSIAGEQLFVADTNNHRVLRVELRSKQVSEFTIAGLKPPVVGGESLHVADEARPADFVTTEAQSIQPDDTVAIAVGLSLPPEYKLNPAYPAAAVVTADGPQVVVTREAIGKRLKAIGEGSELSFELPLTGKAGDAILRISLNYGYCREGKGGLCKVKTARWSLPLTVATGGGKSIRLSAPPAELGTGG